VTVLAATLRYRRQAPALPHAAQLADRHTGAKDHFLTLATIDAAQCSAPLLSRLRQDANDFIQRIELRRDFPYRVKPPAYWSALASLLLVLLLYFLMPPVEARLAPLPDSQRLRELAEKMAQAPRLKELGERLKTLAAKLQDEKMAAPERQAALQETEKKIQEQQKREPEQNNRQLLSQAADALKGSEQQPSSDGREQQSQGGGNLQSNQTKDGEGESKPSPGSAGDGQGRPGAQANKDLPNGKPTAEKPPSQDKNQAQQGAAKGGAEGMQPDPNRRGKESNQNNADKGQGGSQQAGATKRASEEPPQSTPPAERFYRAGEGGDGIKGARYVTVQLPEEVAAEGKGDSKTTKEGSAKRARAQVPVSNTPLPAHVPNAPAEKQPMPLEYRGIIR
jgi:hypothetical protein